MQDFLTVLRFNLQDRKQQLLVAAFLLIILFPLVYLAQKEIKLLIRGVELSRLWFFPLDLLQTPDGRWEFPLNGQVKVELKLNTGDQDIETVEAIFHYDPTVLSAQEIDFSTNTLFPLLNTIVKSIAKDAQGNETGTIYIVRTAIPLPPYDNPDQIPPYDPVPSRVEGTFGLVVFKTLKTVRNSALTYEFEVGGRNDSNVVKYQSAGEDVLGSVENLVFDVVQPAGAATLSLSPNLGTYYLGEPFEVQILLDTGVYQVDSVDVILSYDRNVLTAVSLQEGDLFATYPIKNINETEGKIELSGQIEPGDNPQPVSGSGLLVGTLTFEPLMQSSEARVWFEFDGFGSRNDSNVVKFGQGNDVLGQVVNAAYVLVIQPTPSVTPLPTATLTPQPTVTPTSAPLTPTSTPPLATPLPSLTSTPVLVTPTPTPPMTLNLKIRLQGRNWWKAPMNRRLTLSVMGTPLVLQITGNTNGEVLGLVLSGIASGVYDLLIKPEGFLQRKFIQVNLGSGVNYLDTTSTAFLAGDLDNSGRVNSLDYNVLLANFKSSDVLSDLDGSGQVNSLDFSLMLGNWNKQGDEEGGS